MNFQFTASFITILFAEKKSHTIRKHYFNRLSSGFLIKDAVTSQRVEKKINIEVHRGELTDQVQQISSPLPPT